MRLDPAAARRAVGGLAERLGLSKEHAAEGILTIVNANKANAISSRTVQKGLDPRRFALVAFGGAGPLHGADVARALGIPEVIVPAYPGITSAVGLLTTDLKYVGDGRGHLRVADRLHSGRGVVARNRKLPANVGLTFPLRDSSRGSDGWSNEEIIKCDLIRR
jgi:N-methylhydantoinase A/oxoprolinase/acetone carboxylase beta subunit